MKGLNFDEVFGTKQHVPSDRVRTGHLPVPLSESPVYIVGARDTKTTVRPDSGWYHGISSR